MVFSLRIVTTDHYMSAPIEGLDVCYNEYRGCDVIKVPVIRIYGVTPAGIYLPQLRTCSSTAFEMYKILLRPFWGSSATLHFWSLLFAVFPIQRCFLVLQNNHFGSVSLVYPPLFRVRRAVFLVMVFSISLFWLMGTWKPRFGTDFFRGWVTFPGFRDRA